jgi:hypothetical protein
MIGPAELFKRLQAIAARSPDRTGCLTIAAAWGALAVYTWGCWGSPITDCGREMYVPWQILEGKLLYRDLWYLYGPLAPYLKAGLYAIFGVHLTVLYGFGLAITLATALTLYALGREFLPPVGAAAGSLCFLVQAFQPDLFNFVLPYSYAAALGTWLGLVCVLFLVKFVKTGELRHLAWASWAAALALLDKQEFGLICYLVLGAALALRAIEIKSWRLFPESLARLAPGAALGLSVYGFFAWKTGVKALFLENFQQTPQSHFMQTYGALWVQKAGLRFEARELALCALSAAGCLAFWFVLGRSPEQASWRRPVWFLLLAALVYAGFQQEFFLPIGLMGCVAAGFLWWSARRARGHTEAAPLVLVAAYGMLAGLRTLVEMKPSGYAIFYNEVPLVILLVLIVSITPARSRITWALMALQIAGFAWMAWPQPGPRTWLLASARGALYTTPEAGAGRTEALSFLAEKMRAGQTAVLLPDEPLLYFLADLRGPEPWYQLTPGVVAPDQEARYVEKLQQLCPDYILISNRRFPEYRVPVWGIDYNRQIYQWITQHYRATGEIQPHLRSAAASSAASSPSFLMQIYEKNRSEAPQ